MKEQLRSLPELDTLQIGAELSDSFEPETMSLPVMLFQNRLRDSLNDGDANALRDLFTAFFASIPADNYRNNSILRYEGF